MSDKRKSGVPFESDDATEQQLWSDLEGLPQEAPSQRLRRRFYDELEQADTSEMLAARGEQEAPVVRPHLQPTRQGLPGARRDRHHALLRSFAGHGEERRIARHRRERQRHQFGRAQA